MYWYVHIRQLGISRCSLRRRGRRRRRRPNSRAHTRECTHVWGQCMRSVRKRAGLCTYTDFVYVHTSQPRSEPRFRERKLSPPTRRQSRTHRAAATQQLHKINTHTRDVRFDSIYIYYSSCRRCASSETDSQHTHTITPRSANKYAIISV